MVPQEQSIMQFSKQLFKGLWKRHITNLGLMTCGLLRSKRASIAAIGKDLAVSTSHKHAIKRVDRFLGNPRVNLQRAKANMAHYFSRGKKQLLIACDWTKVGELGVLCAAIAYQGRAIPLYWRTSFYKGMRGKLSQVEDEFFKTLAELLPRDAKVTIVLDRGFCRFGLCKLLESLGFSYVIRAFEKNIVDNTKYRCPVGQLMKPGKWLDLKSCYLARGGINTRFVGHWQSKHETPLILITNLDLPKRLIVRLYENRFQIEMLFRDVKTQRYGFGLGMSKPTSPQRLDNLLLLCFFAHIVSLLIGVEVIKQGLDHQHRANTEKVKRTHSEFTLGLFFMFRIPWHRCILLKNTVYIRRNLFWG